MFNLYKYQKINSYTLEGLRNNTIHFTCPNDYNDPFDCRLKVIIDGTKEEWELFRQKVGLSTIELEDYISDRTITLKDSGEFDKKIQQHSLLNTRIACFSEVNDSVLMWSHYADSHKGICLMFETIRYDQSLVFINFDKKDLYYTNNILEPNQSGILRVRYSDNLPEAYNHLEYDQDKLVPFLITKSTEWLYEKEWRMLLPASALKTSNPRYERDQLKGIIFGINCTDEDIYQVKEAVKNMKVDFFKTFGLNDQYKLGIKKV